MRTIRIEKRTDDYYVAFVEGGYTSCWECGVSYEAAVGKLVLSHPTLVGIEVLFTEKDIQNREAARSLEKAEANR